MIQKIILFLILNFAALGIGGLLMGKGASSEWYQSLNKAPWTPPGWVFGAAWTLIMICFSIYMAKALSIVNNYKILIILFAIQWVLNVSWNPVFFKYHETLLGLVIISLLTILVGYFLFKYAGQLKLWSIFILPYFIWLLIATSLNAYIYFKN